MPDKDGGPGFVGGTLDRADAVRNDPVRLAAAFADPRARLLLMDGLDPVSDGAALATAALGEDATPADHALLGIGPQGPLFVALDAGAQGVARYTPRILQLAAEVTPDQLALYGTARGLVDWHRRHGFCANCGRATRVEKAGWSRRCDVNEGACGTEHFPRTDPVTIMLAEHKSNGRTRILLGRQPRFPAGRYSALAGFVEPGETIEEAVARELWEEAGIRVANVRYVMSQPWPFPSQLMIACIADALDDALTIDRTELDDAMWVDAAGVRAALNGEKDAPFIAPPDMAVAYWLLKHWLDGAQEEA